MPEKIVLVTGSTDGIGKATALELARRGLRVIVHGRNTEKISQARADIQLQAPGALLESAQADLSSLSQVRTMARDILARFERLDVLIHNAGVFMNERVLSGEGFELTLAVNHLAPFVLTRELLPYLRASHGRVITVSSVAHSRGWIDFDDLNAARDFNGYRAYAQSKLANVFFANELAAREKGRFTSNSVHPGVIGTKLLKTGFGIGGADAAQGAATSVRLATADDGATSSGSYFTECREIPVAPHALDLAVQKRLWATSERMTGSA